MEPSKRDAARVLLPLTLLLLAACSGGGGGALPSTPASATPSPASTAGTQSATGTIQFTIAWPAAGSASTSGSRRHINYISPGTKSISLAVDGGTPAVANNPNLSGAGSGTATTTLSVGASIGTHTLSIIAYDATNGTGNILSEQTVPGFQVVETQANVVNATLDGNLNNIAYALATPNKLVTGTKPTFTIYGAAPQTFTLTPQDAQNDVIVSPGKIPSLTLTSADPTSVTVASTSTANQFSVQALKPNASVVLTATGTDLSGKKITATFTVNTVGLIYVANHSVGGTSPTITAYPSNAAANTNPIFTLSGSATQLVQVEYPAVDSNGNLFVSNLGPAPGANYTSTSGYVTEYSPTAQLNNGAPTGIIPQINTPAGLAFDTSGTLYLATLTSINEYPAVSNGFNGSTVAASTVITGSNTGLQSVEGLFVDANGLLYADCDATDDAFLTVFAKGATGNATPLQVINAPGSVNNSTMPIYTTDSFQSVAADSSGRIYTTAFNNNVNAVYVYSAGANDNASTGTAPTPNGEATVGFSQPFGVFIDPAGYIYITNYGSSTLQIFSSETNLLVGNATASITTGIDHPYGVTVR